MIVIRDQNSFLLGKRGPGKQKAPGYWCPISGHVEPNETQEEAVRREALEEIGVEVRPLKRIATTQTRDKTTLLHWWLTEIVHGVPTLANDENSELGWFTGEELKNLRPTFQEDIALLLTLEVRS